MECSRASAAYLETQFQCVQWHAAAAVDECLGATDSSILELESIHPESDKEAAFIFHLLHKQALAGLQHCSSVRVRQSMGTEQPPKCTLSAISERVTVARILQSLAE